MKDDLISRQAAIDVINKIFPVDPMRNDYTKGITCGAALATEYIKQLPSAEPKKGQWVGANAYAKHLTEETGEVYTVSFMETDRFFCNQCWKLGGKLKTNYCPHCGAKMEVTE